MSTAPAHGGNLAVFGREGRGEHDLRWNDLVDREFRLVGSSVQNDANGLSFDWS